MDLSKSFLSCIMVLTFSNLCWGFPNDHGSLTKRQAESIEVVYIGDLIKTEHSVSGSVYAFNESLIIIDEFKFDGRGAGVYINVATEGNNRFQYIGNRKVVDYPMDDPRPIERRYNGERLFIGLPKDIKVSEIKWLSIWCEIFGVSFGEVEFPTLSDLS